jgi:hypothetical protein
MDLHPLILECDQMDRYCHFCMKKTETVSEDCVVCGLSKPRMEEWKQNRKPMEGEMSLTRGDNGKLIKD